MDDTDGTDIAGSNSIGRVGQWLGVLLLVLDGAFTFLGIKGEEVGVILRNQRWEPSILALLLALAFTASITSVFVAGRTAPWPVMVALLGISVAPIPFLTWLVPPPATTQSSMRNALFVAGGLVVGAVLVLFLRRGRRWLLQPVVLFVAVFLLGAVVYGGLRLETRSQYATTSARVSATLATGKEGARFILAVAAEKLRSGDHVRVKAVGLPRAFDIALTCADIERLASSETYREDVARICPQRPCEYFDCPFVAGAQLHPDAFGSVKEHFAFPVDAATYGHLALNVTVCSEPLANGDCREFRPTVVDIRVPPPPAA